MSDREVFRDNLNYYLSVSGKLQKDLADYVGAKTTTVSGWTRGISYPRADAMEKIAMFFGIPTTKLIGSREDDALPISKEDDEALDDLVSIIVKLAPKNRKLAKKILLNLMEDEK